MTAREFYSRRGSVFGFSEQYGPGFHAGQDIRADYGDPIPFPGGSGRVSVVGWDTDPGWFASIICDGQYHQFYHQAERPPLEVGQQISFDQIIGMVGSSGKSSGPHLHYAVSNTPYPGPVGNRVDPWPIIQRMLAENGAGTAGGNPTLYPPTPTERDDEMTIFYKPTGNSSPLSDGTSRIWAGNRLIGGILFSEIWAASDFGTVRRLTRKQWEDIYKLATLRGVEADLNKATFSVTGNELEQIFVAQKL